MVSLTITKSLNSGCLVIWKIIQKVKAYFLCHLSIYRGNGLCRWKMKLLMMAPTIHMTPTMSKMEELLYLKNEKQNLITSLMACRNHADRVFSEQRR